MKFTHFIKESVDQTLFNDFYFLSTVGAMVPSEASRYFENELSLHPAASRFYRGVPYEFAKEMSKDVEKVVLEELSHIRPSSNGFKAVDFDGLDMPPAIWNFTDTVCGMPVPVGGGRPLQSIAYISKAATFAKTTDEVLNCATYVFLLKDGMNKHLLDRWLPLLRTVPGYADDPIVKYIPAMLPQKGGLVGGWKENYGNAGWAAIAWLLKRMIRFHNHDEEYGDPWLHCSIIVNALMQVQHNSGTIVHELENFYEVWQVGINVKTYSTSLDAFRPVAGYAEQVLDCATAAMRELGKAKYTEASPKELLSQHGNYAPLARDMTRDLIVALFRELSSIGGRSYETIRHLMGANMAYWESGRTLNVKFRGVSAMGMTWFLQYMPMAMVREFLNVGGDQGRMSDAIDRAYGEVAKMAGWRDIPALHLVLAPIYDVVNKYAGQQSEAIKTGIDEGIGFQSSDTFLRGRDGHGGLVKILEDHDVIVKKAWSTESIYVLGDDKSFRISGHNMFGKYDAEDLFMDVDNAADWISKQEIYTDEKCPGCLSVVNVESLRKAISEYCDKYRKRFMGESGAGSEWYSGIEKANVEPVQKPDAKPSSNAEATNALRPGDVFTMDDEGVSPTQKFDVVKIYGEDGFVKYMSHGQTPGDADIQGSFRTSAVRILSIERDGETIYGVPEKPRSSLKGAMARAEQEVVPKAESPQAALKYEQGKRVETWQVLEDEYVEHKRQYLLTGYDRELKLLRSQKQTFNNMNKIEAFGLWRGKLQSFEFAKQHWHGEYVATVKKAILKGLPVPLEVVGQYPEFTVARNARARYDKGVHTSFANKSVAVDDSMQADRGFKVKRQDGKPIKEEQKREIVAGVSEIEEVVGNLKHFFREADITIAHTSGLHPFLRKSGGLWNANENTITTGIANVPSLAHEFGHALDYLAGAVLGKKTTVFGNRTRGSFWDGGKSLGRITALSEAEYVSRAGDGYDLIKKAYDTIHNPREARYLMHTKLKDAANEETQEKINRSRISLGDYWDRPREIWARLVEQYVALKRGGDAGVSHSPSVFYETDAGWWTQDDFEVLAPMVGKELQRRLDAVNSVKQ